MRISTTAYNKRKWEGKGQNFSIYLIYYNPNGGTKIKTTYTYIHTQREREREPEFYFGDIYKFVKFLKS